MFTVRPSGSRKYLTALRKPADVRRHIAIGVGMRKELKWYSFRWQTGVILLIVAFSSWHCLVGRFRHPVGEGPAGPPLGISSFQHAWSAQKTVLVGLGDSITAGFGASDRHSYFELLVSNDDTRYPDMKGRDLRHVLPELDVLDYSLSYSTSEECLKDQLPRLGVFPGEIKGIVVITTGGNDIIHDYGRSAPKDGAMYGCSYEQALKWKENYRNRLAAIIQGVTDRFPGGCELFVANVYDPTDGVGDIENAGLRLPRWRDGIRVLALMNQVIAEVCSSYENTRLVDIHSEFLGHGIHCRDRRNKHYREHDPHYWYYDNLEDPNDRGYDAIRRLFLIEMAKVYSGNRASNKPPTAPRVRSGYRLTAAS